MLSPLGRRPKEEVEMNWMIYVNEIPFAGPIEDDQKNYILRRLQHYPELTVRVEKAEEVKQA